VKNTTTEIGELIFSYNEMVDEIEKSKKALAKIEREKMWKDMAKQIAHEIKNPLTPMRLSVQNFERRFTPEDPQCREKVANFTQMLLQHIDTLSDISDAFSSFVSMPAQKKELSDINAIIRRTIAVFDLPYIHFESSQETIELCVDRNQMNRMLTNLLKNALYATDSTPTPLIEVTSFIEGNYAYIVVKDNGSGVPIELQERIFEPKFTTKNTAGSGLGLAMVKHIVSAHAGEITLSSEVGKGASFTIKLSGVGQETNL
jgi:histidine kinase